MLVAKWENAITCTWLEKENKCPIQLVFSDILITLFIVHPQNYWVHDASNLDKAPNWSEQAGCPGWYGFLFFAYAIKAYFSSCGLSALLFYASRKTLYAICDQIYDQTPSVAW